ncbi:hypothetical protein JZU51_00575 [bacterium]|nr:hypothetical protein [bacterium]
MAMMVCRVAKDGRENQQAEHHQRWLTKGEGQHGDQHPNRKRNVGNPVAFQTNQVIPLIFDVFFYMLGSRFYRMDNAQQNIG